MYTHILVVLLCSGKLVTLFLKLEEKKITDFEALTEGLVDEGRCMVIE